LLEPEPLFLVPKLIRFSFFSPDGSENKEMRQKLASSHAGISKVECPECATTRSLDGPLGGSTILFPPKTKNEHVIAEILMLKILPLLVLRVTHWRFALLESK
jgi:hypothetical protein